MRPTEFLRPLGYPGPLDLASVRRLRLQAELAALSACETGIGRWVRGGGVVGTQHAFLAAGARRKEWVASAGERAHPWRWALFVLVAGRRRPVISAP